MTHIGGHAARVARLATSCFTGFTGVDMAIDAKAAKFKAVNSDLMLRELRLCVCVCFCECERLDL